MRTLFIVTILLLVNSCAHNKLQYSRKRKHDSGIENTRSEEKSAQKEKIIEFTEVVPEPEEKANGAEQLQPESNEVIAFDTPVQEHPEVVTQEKKKQVHAEKKEQVREKKRDSSKAFSIVGRILLIAGIAVFSLGAGIAIMGQNENPDTSNDPIGCAISVAVISAVVLIGFLVGLMGLLMVITGLIFLGLARKEKKQNETGEQENNEPAE